MLWVMLLVWALLGWSPSDRGNDLSQVLDIVKREWRTGDIIYHNNDMTAVLFSYYFPDKPVYVIDEDDLTGGKGIVDLMQVPVNRVSLEQIPHQRSSMVWAVFHMETDKRPAEWLMRVPTPRRVY